MQCIGQTIIDVVGYVCIVYANGTGADVGLGLGHFIPADVDTGHLCESVSQDNHRDNPPAFQSHLPHVH